MQTYWEVLAYQWYGGVLCAGCDEHDGRDEPDQPLGTDPNHSSQVCQQRH